MVPLESDSVFRNMTVHGKNNQIIPDRTYSETSIKALNNTVEENNSKITQTTQNVTENNRNPNSIDLKAMISNFLKISSNYALNQVGCSTTKTRKIFWLLVFIIGLIGSLSQVGQFLSVYFSYPVVICLNVINVKKQQLPAVTICNVNVIKKNFLPCLENKLSYNECFSTSRKARSNIAQEDNDTHKKQNTSLAYCEEAEGNITKKNLEFESSFHSLDFDDRVKYGHNVKDFIHSCSFNGRLCSYKDFKVSSSYTHGSCYTFNSATENKPALNMQFHGPSQALELIINLESDEYIPYTDAVGARVQIHNRHEEPYVEEDGLNLSPGFETSLALSKYSITRLPAPYKDMCKEYALGESIQKCQRECFNDLSVEFCSCSLVKDNSKKFRPCNFTNPYEYCCLLEINKEECENRCPLPCEETHYKIKASSLVWPSKPYYDMYSEDFRTSDLSNLSFEKVRTSWLKLKIYFDTLDHKTYQQKAMFQSSEVFSQIGGQLGLWLGLSLIFLFECVVNFMDILMYERKRISDHSHE